jgi:hypothetical protein
MREDGGKRKERGSRTIVRMNIATGRRIARYRK